VPTPVEGWGLRLPLGVGGGPKLTVNEILCSEVQHFPKIYRRPSCEVSCKRAIELDPNVKSVSTHGSSCGARKCAGIDRRLPSLVFEADKPKRPRP